MKIAVHQPDYLPWCGFFYKMAQVDLFVLLDDCGFSRQRATHRVQIRRPDGGVRWLSVPVGKTTAPINELVPDPRQTWGLNHWNILLNAYSTTDYWHEVAAWLQPLLTQSWATLPDFTIACLQAVRRVLGLTTQMTRTSELPPEVKATLGTSGTRIVNLCRHYRATTYFSGQGARAYNDEAEFAAAGVRLEYSTFAPAPYPQTGPDFIAGLSLLDVLANCGADYAKTLIAKKL